MANTIPGLLNDTYHLVQLARESALAQGKQTQASKLSPVVEDLKNLVGGNCQARQSASTTAAAPVQKSDTNPTSAPAGSTGISPVKATGATPVKATGVTPVRATGATPVKATGVMAQSDFQTLLNAAKSVPAGGRAAASNNITERNQMVRSMASSNMMDVDIARRMGMTREEVRLIISVGGK